MDKPLNSAFIRALKSGRTVRDAGDELRAALDRDYQKRLQAIREEEEVAHWVAIGLKSPVGTIPRAIAEGYLKDYEERERAEEAQK